MWEEGKRQKQRGGREGMKEEKGRTRRERKGMRKEGKKGRLSKGD